MDVWWVGQSDWNPVTAGRTSILHSRGFNGQWSDADDLEKAASLAQNSSEGYHAHERDGTIHLLHRE